MENHKKVEMSLNKVAIFMVLTLGCSTIFYVPIISGKMTTALTFGLMWMPALSAVLTQWITGGTLRDFGWKLGPGRYLVLGVLIPLTACMVVYGFVWISGLGEVSMSALTTAYHKPVRTILWMLPTVIFLFNLVAALGEEIGWRGFLTAELSKRYGYIKTSWMVTIIWFVWHSPLMILSTYRNQDTPIWYNLLVVSVAMMAFTFISVWIRLQSGSLWTAAVFHACHNLFIQQVFDVMTVKGKWTHWITSEFGCGIAVVYAVLAFWLINRRRS